MQVICCDKCSLLLGVGDEGKENTNTVTFYSSSATAHSTNVYHTFMLCDSCFKQIYDSLLTAKEVNIKHLNFLQ